MNSLAVFFAIVRTALLSVLIGLPLAHASGSAEIPTFNPADELCFKNGDPDFAKAGIPFLGKLAVKKGACQGMSAIVSAFQERAEFVPSRERASESKIRDQVKKIVYDFRRGCEIQKIKISGFSNLSELCATQKNFFLRQSLLNNADIAIHEIAGELADFLIHKKEPMTKTKDLQQVADTIQGFKYWLSMGRKPLLLIHSHVMAVLGIEERVQEVDGLKTILWVYDSNKVGLSRYEIKLDPTGFPAVGQKKLWDVTPNRGCGQALSI